MVDRADSLRNVVWTFGGDYFGKDFRDVTLRVMEIAARRCNGRIVSLLEGGYAPEDLGKSVAAHVGALMEG